MRRVRFEDAAGQARTGELVGETIVYGTEEIDLDSVDILPPVEPTKIWNLGANHETFIRDNDDYDRPESPADHPFSLRPPTVTVGHEKTILIPESETMLAEIELGVVFGRECRNVPEADAMDVIDGFTVVNDVTATSRDYPSRKKAIDNAVPIGPVVASPDEVPSDATLETRINGEVTQQASRSGYLHDAAALVAELTEHLTFYPGDVISIGSPAGIKTITAGDHLELSIEGIGTLVNDVAYYN